MENNESKAKYVGEIAVVALLEIIMLLFRLVQPIRWPGGVSITLQSFGNEFIFFGIELGLIVIIVGHLIFKHSFKEMGLTHFKENIAPLIINLCFVGICVAAGYLGSQFSKGAEFDFLNIGLQIIANFIAIAVLQELIFRGFLFNTTLKLTNGNGIVASVITAILFTLTYIPNILLSLNEVQVGMVLSALIGPFLFGLYLSLIYYYGKNLWICTIIHGVCLSIASFEPDIFITLLAGVYIISLLIYLVYKIIAFYRHGDEEDEKGEEIEEARLEQEEEETAHIEESEEIKVEPSQAVQKVTHIEEAPQEEKVSVMANKSIETITENKDDGHQAVQEVTEIEEAKKEVSPIQETTKDVDVSVTEEVETQTAVEESKGSVIEVPSFKNHQLTPAEQLKHDVAKELEKTMVLPDLPGKIDEVMKQEVEEDEVEDDLQKIAALSSNKEELGKVVNLQARKEQLDKAGKLHENFDDTVVMPSISEETKRETLAYSNLRDLESMVEKEPNFIAHLEQYLGEFEGIYKQVLPTEPPIDILYFSGEDYNALVTNGMRAVPMVVPSELNDYRQVELMMFVDKSFDLSGEGLQKEENAWLIKLLTDLATYPRQTNSYLGWGHIVGNGESVEPYDESVDYCGALIYPPMDQENVKFYRYVEKDRNIFIYNVMPLFANELRFVQEHSSDRFINLMCEMGVKQRVVPERINIIEEMNRR